MGDLEVQRCEACTPESLQLTDEQIDELKPQVPQWEIMEDKKVRRLQRVFKFKDFREALEFTQKVGDLAEQESHHPLIITEFGKVTVEWWTHKIYGLHRNDFIAAAKTDRLTSSS